MTLAHWTHDATDEAGNILTSVTVEVRRESDNGLASLYSDDASVTPLGNSYVDADGKVDFYVTSGLYKVTLSKTGYTTRVLNDVAIGRAQELDYGATGATVLTATTAAAARSTLGLDTANSPQFTGIEVGHASDTTVTRSAAGVLAVEGTTLIKGALGSTDNKLLRADGTGAATAQDSAVTVNDSGDIFTDAGGVYGGSVKQATAHTGNPNTPNLQVLSTGSNASLLMARYSDNASVTGRVFFAKSRGATIGTHTTVGANDILGEFSFAGSDGTDFSHGATLQVQSVSATPGTDYVSSRFDFLTSVSNALPATRMRIAGGVFHSSATGTDKGDNTINFGAVYDDNTLLTCMALQTEFLEKGEIDLAKWDALVPDQIVPAQIVPEVREIVAVMWEVEVTASETVIEQDQNGRLVRRFEDVTRTIEVPAVIAEPIYDERGKIVDAVETPLVDEVVTPEIIIPEQVIVREHRTARLFKAMIESGFDPRDPEAYFAKMHADEALPGMPSKANWEHNSLSAGEMMGRLWLAAEMQAIVANVMWGKLKDHETRMSALEGAARR